MCKPRPWPMPGVRGTCQAGASPQVWGTGHRGPPRAGLHSPGTLVAWPRLHHGSTCGWTPHLCRRQRTAPSEGAPAHLPLPGALSPAPSTHKTILVEQDSMGRWPRERLGTPSVPTRSHQPENQAQGSVRNHLHFPDSAQNEPVRTAPRETGRASGRRCAPGKGLDHNLDTHSTALGCAGVQAAGSSSFGAGNHGGPGDPGLHRCPPKTED